MKNVPIGRVTALFLLLLLLLSACTASDSYPAANSEWELTSLTAAGQPIDLTALSTPVTLKVEKDDQISGFSGCNTYGGTMSFAEDGTLSSSNIFQTEMACETGMDVEASYFGTLAKVSQYQYKADTLLLSSADGQNILAFSAK
jgi:putative lipoprotein